MAVDQIAIERGLDRMRNGLASIRGWALELSHWGADAVRRGWQSSRQSGNGEVKSEQGAHEDPMALWRSAARQAILIVGLFSICINVLMLTMPLYMFQLSDRVLISRSADTLIMLSLVALGLIAILSLLDILRREILGRLATRCETILGAAVISSIIRSAPTGDGANLAALRSLQQVRNFIASPVLLMMFDAPLAPLYFAAVFLIHPDLGFIGVGAAAVLLGFALMNQRATAGPLTQSAVHISRADAQAESLARNAQTINAMGMLNESIVQWGREQARGLISQVDAQERNYWIGGGSKFFRLVTQVVILGWGAHLALAGNLTGGMMIAASIIIGRALLPLEGMIEGWRSVVQMRSAYARVCAALEAIQREPSRLQLPKPQGRITVEKALYVPPGSKEPILNGISFELTPGESLAVVGLSGSGKSTLARILVGCLYPTAGKVRLDGTELRNWDRRQFGEFTGYLPQEVELFPGTIRENVCRLRNDLPDSDVYAAAKAADVHDMICQLPSGYETVLERTGSPLSGGQKQRIALARAFFGNPCFVVLDEPNSNLDALGEQLLATTLRRAKESGVTVVVVTQRPSLLNAVDKVLVLRAGRMEAFGPPQEVFHRLVNADAGRAVAGSGAAVGAPTAEAKMGAGAPAG